MNHNLALVPCLTPTLTPLNRNDKNRKTIGQALLLRSALPVVALATGVFAGVFAWLAAVIPFLIEPKTPLFVAVAVLVAAPLFAVGAELPSLVSVSALPLLPSLVAGRDTGAFGVGAAAGFRPRPVPVAWEDAELALDVLVMFRLPPARVALAFSTMLDKILVAAAERLVPADFRGDPGLAICDLAGEAGRSRLFRRELDDVGDSIWAGRTDSLSAWLLRVFFLGYSTSTLAFSLSPDISSL